ncbi:MAG: hypothetical protein N2C12_14740, partial [Planctomycetales bacterium]
LMSEGRYVAEDGVDTAATELVGSGNATVTAAGLTARLAHTHSELMTAKRMKDEGIPQALLAAEQAAIPMLYETSLVYPAAEIWQNLTLRRAHYASMEMTDVGSTEKKILAALDEQTRIQFDDGTLDDVKDYLGAFHDITVVLDQTALEDIGVDSTTRIIFSVNGISLRSALRLVLRKVDPSIVFIVQNEVLMITTQQRAEDYMVTRNYPVADLVLPIGKIDFSSVDGMSSGGRQQGYGLGVSSQQSSQPPGDNGLGF